MFTNYNKRGSVLLMVVGLLVILGTLGGTFLLISNLDARQSKLLAGRGKAEIVASGAVGKIVRVLGTDLHFAPGMSSAPYTEPNIDGDNAYKNYIDHYSVDPYLFSEDTDPPHYSNVFGNGTGKLVSTEYPHDEAKENDRDAYLVPTGEYSDEGEEYYIAVKVIDLCSLISVNTAGQDYVKGQADTSEVIKSPALVKLNEWVGDNYSKIHSARCGDDAGGGQRTLQMYDRQCGRILLTPEANLNYAPFGVSDEVYLRWLGTGRKARFGRLYDKVSDLSIAKRRRLTTMNSSRSILRNPISGVVSSRFDLSDPDVLEGAGMEGLYTQLVMIAGSDDGQGGGATSGSKQVRDDSGGGFYVSSRQWKKTSSSNVGESYKGTCRRCRYSQYKAWWVFDDLPQATYRIWATWGKGKVTGASVVPFNIYSGGTITASGSTAKYSGGKLLGSAVADQSDLPNDESFDGQKWKALKGFSVEGRLVVEINGPQGVTSGQTPVPYAFADAVRIEGVGVQLGSGSQPAAHLTANMWSAVSERDAKKAYAYKPQGKEYTVFGVQDQPFLTEAFATHTSRTLNPDATYVEDSWKWGAAIELMNFSDKAINLKEDYVLVLGSSLDGDTAVLSFPAGSTIPAGTKEKGRSLVFYDFDTGKGDADPSQVFAAAGGWKRIKGLNFDNQMIRLVRIAEGHRIPIDHVIADPTEGHLEYIQPTEQVKTSIVDPGMTVWANCRRDDDAKRYRYAVAKYWKDSGKKKVAQPATNHTLGADNIIGTNKLAETVVKTGFRIKVPHGLLEGPGAHSNLYLAGPIVYEDGSSKPNDLPGILAKEYATEESRGRANSYAKNTSGANYKVAPWNSFPRQPVGRAEELAWPVLISEVIETVPMDLARGDSPNRVYGRINVNTASAEVLKLLPWPEGITSPDAAAAAIIKYREAKQGFVTPGEVAMALKEVIPADNDDIDRDTVYSAISSCITVNSDMFAVSIRVQLGRETTPDRAWYYLAVIDRGCAVFPVDKPAVLLFTQVE